MLINREDGNVQIQRNFNLQIDSVTFSGVEKTFILSISNQTTTPCGLDSLEDNLDGS